ncbi:DUF3899 domain-containing protein [Virgibacillus kekensis]|uniref:DUF3899 domain-containing protein n=1 Tax=Virgibacillus kekensis TaxID=202261 RepID=A0ABV9DH63_9BACI
MIKKYQAFTYTFISAVVLSVLLTGYFYKTDFTVVDVINVTFMVGMIYLVVGTSLFLIQQGSFDGITYSFKRFFRRSSSYGDMLREVTPEEEEESYLPKQRSFRLTYPLMVTGIIFFSLTVIAGFLI